MFTLPDLPYDYSALEPHVDAATMQVHHGKHHAAYIKNLNTLLEPHPDLQKKDLIELITHPELTPEDIRQKVRNQAGGVLNHELFWKFMTPETTGVEGKLLEAINSAFSGLDLFMEQFSAAASSHFGSGWAWLVSDQGKLKITTTANQDSPYALGQIPLLGIDVWEHAYYLKYQNRRPEYIAAWWHVVNWKEVSARFIDASY